MALTNEQINALKILYPDAYYIAKNHDHKIWVYYEKPIILKSDDGNGLHYAANNLKLEREYHFPMSINSPVIKDGLDDDWVNSLTELKEDMDITHILEDNHNMSNKTVKFFCKQLNSQFNLDAVPSQEFNGESGGIWIKNSKSIKNNNGYPMFHYKSSEDDIHEEIWVMGVDKVLYYHLQDNALYAEFYDPDTVLIFN